MKHYDLLDSRGGDLIVAAGHRVQVQVADGTAGVAPELQVGEDAGSRQEDALRLDRRQLAGSDGVARRDAGCAAMAVASALVDHVSCLRWALCILGAPGGPGL